MDRGNIGLPLLARVIGVGKQQQVDFGEVGGLIRTVMTLHTEVCTVVRTYAGLSESFKIIVGLYQRSVLSPLLFALIMDVVSSEVRSLMTPTVEKLGSRLADGGVCFLDKGFKGNAGNSKIMVGSSGRKMILNSGKWPCCVCGKGVQENSVVQHVKSGFTSGLELYVVTCRW